MWFKVSKSLVKTSEDILFGVVYIPPPESRFHNVDEIELLEVETISSCIQNDYVLLTGDFNARTHVQSHILEADDFIVEHFNFDTVFSDFFNISSLLTQSNLTIQRTSKDSTINNEGNELLELCKSNNLCILNGKRGEDKNIVNFTFRNTSVIDYTITSVEALKFIDNFCISKLDSLYTDGHSLLTTALKLKKNLKKVSSVNKTDKNIKAKHQWNEKKVHEFRNNIDRNKILQLNNTIEHAQNNVNDTCINDINNICSEITNLFVESASRSFGINNNKLTIPKTNRPHKQWLGFQCQIARKNYHDAKRAYNLNPSHTTKTNLNNCSKNIKAL